MKVIAKQDRDLVLINAKNTQNENDVETLQITVPEKYEDFNKKIVFITDDGVVWDLIENDTYTLKRNITKYDSVKFYIWLTKGEVDFRSQTKTLKFYHNVDASEEITPEEIGGVNTVINLLEEEITKVENMNLELSKSGRVTTLTVTDKDGETTSQQVFDGEGLDFNWRGTELGVKKETDEDYEYVELVGDCNFATFDVNENMELVMNKTADMLLDFNLDEENMMLEVVI